MSGRPIVHVALGACQLVGDLLTGRSGANYRHRA